MQTRRRQGQLHAFVDELRRREVFQTAGLYAVGAFLLTEILLAFIDRSPLSASTRSLAGCILVSLFVGGFPIVLWLAWLFDLTRHGIIREEAWARGRYAMAASAMAAVIVTTCLVLWALNPCGFGRVIGVAVLPCSYHGDAEFDFQGRGISAELNYRLSHLPQLQVPANDSIVHYSDRLLNPGELALALGVDRLVDCALRRSNSRMTFNLRLYSPEDVDGQWTEEYTGQADDELFLIAGALGDLTDVDALEVLALAGPAVDEINSMPTASHDAWSLFQRAGNAELEGDSDTALLAYRRAAVIDPTFARAHTSAARLMWLASFSPEVAQADAAAMLNAARAHLRQALQEPRVAAETLMMQRELNGPGQNPDSLHAEIIARRPSYADEFLMWGLWLAGNDRDAEAEAALTKARLLDPSGSLEHRYDPILSARP